MKRAPVDGLATRRVSTGRAPLLLAALILLAGSHGVARAQGFPPAPMPGGGGRFAGPPPGPHGGPPPFALEREALESLDLSEAQHDRLRRLFEDEERRLIPLEAEARLAELDLESLLDAGTPDSRAVDAQVDRVAAARGAMLHVHVATRLGLRAILTPAQRVRLRRPGPGMRPGPRDHGAPR